MSQTVGMYTLVNKAKVDLATGAVVIVNQLVETTSGRLLLDDVPTSLVATIRTNLQAVAGQYDTIGV